MSQQGTLHRGCLGLCLRGQSPRQTPGNVTKRFPIPHPTISTILLGIQIWYWLSMNLVQLVLMGGEATWTGGRGELQPGYAVIVPCWLGHPT